MENVFYDDLDCLYENLADPCNESQENSTPLASSSVLGANLPQPLLIEKAAAVQLRSPLKSRAQFHQAQPSNLQSTLLTYQETELKEVRVTKCCCMLTDELTWALSYAVHAAQEICQGFEGGPGM